MPLSPSAATAVGYAASERTWSARAGAVLFRHRGWLPVPFLAIPILLPGETSPLLWTLGLALMVLGEAWRLAGVAAAGTTTRRRSRNVQRLVTYGAFSWNRNPLYCGNFLIWMGVTTLSGVLWFLPIAIALFAVEYSLIVRFEEGVLESTFGETYLAYKGQTPRWLPTRPTAGAGSAGTAAQGDREYNWGEAWRSELSTFLQYAVLLAVFGVKTKLGSRWW